MRCAQPSLSIARLQPLHERLHQQGSRRRYRCVSGQCKRPHPKPHCQHDQSSAIVSAAPRLLLYPGTYATSAPRTARPRGQRPERLSDGQAFGPPRLLMRGPPGSVVAKITAICGRSGPNAGCHRSVWHARGVLDSGEGLAHLTEAERAWVRHSEELWTQAHRIAAACPSIDAGDVYHSLRCLELSPSERLARGLSRGRLRTYAR